jgi:adenosylhomocysteine nucleosidase
MKTLAVFAALPWECTAAVQWLQQVERGRTSGFVWWQGRAADHRVRVVRTGIGAERAAAAVRDTFSQFPFELAVSTGCAGGLVPALEPGALVVATEVVCDHDGTRYATAPLDQDALPPNHWKLSLHFGRQLCVRSALSTAAEKQAAGVRFEALAVDMESAGVARSSTELGVPFVSVRAILDPVAAALPGTGTLLDPTTGQVRPWQLFRALATGGGELWSELRALQHFKRQAQTALGIFFRVYFSSLAGNTQTASNREARHHHEEEPCDFRCTSRPT